MRADPAGLRVGLRADAGPRTGVGHLLRCIALAEELRGRGAAVSVLGDVGGLPWARRQLAVRDLPLQPAPPDPPGLAAAVRDAGLDAVVLDAYDLPAGTGTALRRQDTTVLAVVDGPYGRHQEADLYLDQNLAPPERDPGWPPDAPLLAGVRYALLRDLVRARRPAVPPVARTDGPPAVLAVFGGTDPQRAALVLAPLLLDTGCPMALTVLTGDDEVVAALDAVPRARGQGLTLRPPVDDLPALVADADLVVSAAGTSTWELCCLGAASVVVCVTDNQEVGYRRVVAAGMAAPGGHLAALRADPVARQEAVRVLAGLLGDPVSRAALAERGWRAVDGRGRERVADALLAAVARRRPTTG